MEYVIPAVLVLIAIGGLVTFLVLNATKKSGPVAEREDEGAPGMGTDPTPLGDTTQHAGRETGDGATAGGQDAEASGGTGRPVHSGTAGASGAGEDFSQADPDAAAHVARPGEGEGHQRLGFEAAPPPSTATAPGPARPAEAERSEPAPEPQPAAEAAPEPRPDEPE